MIVSSILKALQTYRAQGLPAPTLILSSKALEEIQAECDYTCGCDKDGNPMFLGIRWLLD